MKCKNSYSFVVRVFPCVYNRYKGVNIGMIIDILNEVLNSTDSHTTMYYFCDFIKTHIHDISHITIEEVAKDCFTSKGQISKCAKRLGFASYLEFKDACIDYSHSLLVKPVFFSKEDDLPQNNKTFAEHVSKTIGYVSEHINYAVLNRLINDILGSRIVYLYAQGDNRSLCNVIQVELSALYVSVAICDADFIKEYQFNDEDVLIILSTNATIFNLNKRIISRLLKANVKTWLVTCNTKMEFPKNTLCVPSYHDKYNKFAIRHVVDIIIYSIQLMQKKK